MKVAEYLPYYGLITNLKKTFSVLDENLPVKELLTNHPDIELSNEHIDELNTIDFTLLNEALNHLYIDDEIVKYILYKLLDAYIKRGGNGLIWLSNTQLKINDTSQNYPNDLKIVINAYLFSMLFAFNNPTAVFLPAINYPKPATGSGRKIRVPAYHNLLESFNTVSDYHDVMIKLKMQGYCMVNGTWCDYKSGWKGIIILLIKGLAIQNFCKKTKFSTSEIQNICTNTFKTEKLSFSSITHVHHTPAEFTRLFGELRNTISASLLAIFAILIDYAWIADCLDSLLYLNSFLSLVSLASLLCLFY